MRKTITVDHLARVEGHGGITLELSGDSISSVRFDIFEGARLIEGLIRGRRFADVSQIVSRICAICSVAHSLTSLKATEKAFGIEISPQTELLRDLLFRGENIESHALHLFLLAVPDYLEEPSAMAVAGVNPEAVTLGLRLKKLGNTIQETVGGRAVHPVNAVIGGFGSLPGPDRLIALRNDLLQGIADCNTMIDLLSSLPPADICHTDTVFAAVQSPGTYGYYAGEEIIVLSDEAETVVPVADYKSLIIEKAVPHSHAKHSSFNGEPFMVGALSRLAVNRESLTGAAVEAVEKLNLALPSDNPMDNNKAQAVELVFDVEHALHTVEHILNEGLTDEPPPRVEPSAGTGTAATEAPRGILIHSYSYDPEGMISSADVITPTAMNAASVERHIHAAIEQSPEKDVELLTRKMEMIARAYDPCISCSVH